MRRSAASARSTKRSTRSRRSWRVGAGGVARVDERREHVVAGVEASAEQLVGDGDALALVAEVADDAEQVARVDAGGQRADAALGLEDGDGRRR